MQYTFSGTVEAARDSLEDASIPTDVEDLVNARLDRADDDDSVSISLSGTHDEATGSISATLSISVTKAAQQEPVETGTESDEED